MSDYLNSVLKASGGAGAPAELLDPSKIQPPRTSPGLAVDDTLQESLEAAGYLVPEEQDLADALIEIVEKHGKFNADNTGVWAGYDSAEKNAENAAIGVKCGNCIFWEAPNGCNIIQAETEEGGLCRFAILPDGAVTADADYGDECPPATQDIQLNLENRQNAIDNVGYGPLNPAEPNDIFWQDKAERWNTTVREAKTAVCGNCIFFIRTPKVLDCLETGIGLDQEAEGTIAAGELGYCSALDFKCASQRTCNAWAAGGPITEETEGVTATAGSKPAPKKDRIFGSKKNKKGSASGGKKVTFSKKVEKSLQEKADKHNEKHGDTASKKTSLKTLKAVYRRGAGAFSTSHRPDQNRNSWAMARVNAFLHLLRTGKPKNAKYTTDNDLLPAAHARSSKKDAAITASAFDSYIDSQLEVALLSSASYATAEDAIFALAEFSDLSYDAIPAIRAAWLRAQRDGEDSFERAKELAVMLYESKDADLLPKKEAFDGIL